MAGGDTGVVERRASSAGHPQAVSGALEDVRWREGGSGCGKSRQQFEESLVQVRETETGAALMEVPLLGRMRVGHLLARVDGLNLHQPAVLTCFSRG